MIDRRNFLKFLGVGIAGAGLLLDEAVQVNRVYFFPKEIKLYSVADQQLVLMRRHLRYDVTMDQVHAAERGEISWESLQGHSWTRPAIYPKPTGGAVMLKGKPIETFKNRQLILTDQA